MSTLQVVIRGTLTSDGSLELAERPSLPAGPVEVIIRSIPTADTASEDFLQYLQRARTELEAADPGFRTKEEIDTELDPSLRWLDIQIYTSSIIKRIHEGS
jgi:hypothetical protein